MPTPFYNKDNAKAYSAKGHLTQSRLAAERREQKKTAKTCPPTPQPTQVAIQPMTVISDDDAYRLGRLVQVRIIVSRLDDALLHTTDPMEIEKLSRAGHRYSQIEQMLAGRPSPGSRKPAPDRPSRPQSAGALSPLMSSPPPEEPPVPPETTPSPVVI